MLQHDPVSIKLRAQSPRILAGGGICGLVTDGSLRAWVLKRYSESPPSGRASLCDGWARMHVAWRRSTGSTLTSGLSKIDLKLLIQDEVQLVVRCGEGSAVYLTV